MLGSGNTNVNKTGFLSSVSSQASRASRPRGGFLKNVQFELFLEWVILEQANVKEERDLGERQLG